MGAIMVTPRLLVALLVAALALPAGAQVFDVVPYQLVGAFGKNNERDVNEGSCDLVLGCYSTTGELCASDPNQGCNLATVPSGRCVTGNRGEDIWPSKGGECVGTIGYFERGPSRLGKVQQNSVGGVPCLTDNPNDDGSPDYAAALAAFSVDPSRDRTLIDALEAVNGPSSMCAGNGICAHKRCAVAITGTGVVACETNADCTATPEDECVQVNDNTANCQAFDPKPSVCNSDNSRKCGIDVDCAKTCSSGAHRGESCETSLLDCKDGVGTNPGVCVPISGDCLTADNDFEPGVCGGTQARCSDGDPDLAVGGAGLGFCSDIVIIGQIDSSQNCGRNAGAEIRSSPRNPRENPFFLYTPQRDPGTGFLGIGVIREVRATSAVRIQDAADAMANTLGIRSISTIGPSAWGDAAFSASDVNGALDTIVLGTRCDAPEEWEVQLPVEGNCSAPNEDIFCVADEDCPAGTCENLFFCYERKDPNQPELGPALDSVAFLWQREIVDNEPIPAGLPAIYRDGNGDPVWSTNPLNPTCPPICGTEYDHNTFESEAITNLGALDRAAGIQLALNSLSGRRAGEGDMVAVDATTTVAFINIGDIRCQLGGQDPNNLDLVGTCTSSKVPCDPDFGGICAPGETCEACGGTLIRAGDPLAASKGLNERALPIGYDDRGIDALKLIENQRLGVLNSSPATVTISIFLAVTTGIVGSTSTDNPSCNPSGDRCVLGETPGSDPGAVGIGAGGTFVTDQVFAHGGQNRSGGPVSWDPADEPGPAQVPYVRPGSFGVGPDGIPGCMGNNSPRNNASDACRKRLSRGQETGQQDPNKTVADWGFCFGGGEGWLPEPPPPCQTTTQFFNCQFPFNFCVGVVNDGLSCEDDADCCAGVPDCPGSATASGTCVSGTCRNEICQGGTNDGGACTSSVNDCPGLCQGGINDGGACTRNSGCPPITSCDADKPHDFPSPYPGATCGTTTIVFNTGADDLEILMPVVDEGLGPRTDEGAFSPGTRLGFPRPVVPNPSAPKPTFHLIGAGTLRDLDLLEGVDNADIVFKTEVTSCPIDLLTGGPDCFNPGGGQDPCAGQGGDTDGDEVCDDVDNCPSVSNPGAPQDDSDGDGVGDACDNCMFVSNPRVASPLAWMTLTGGQRDDDADGYGNLCDAKFATGGEVVGTADLSKFIASLFKSRETNECGVSGTDPCAWYDLDEKSTAIGTPDLSKFIEMLFDAPGPKCGGCPLF